MKDILWHILTSRDYTTTIEYVYKEKKTTKYELCGYEKAMFSNSCIHIKTDVLCCHNHVKVQTREKR